MLALATMGDKKDSRSFRPLPGQNEFLAELEQVFQTADIVRAALSLLQKEKDPFGYIHQFLHDVVDQDVLPKLKAIRTDREHRKPGSGWGGHLQGVTVAWTLKRHHYHDLRAFGPQT